METASSSTSGCGRDRRGESCGFLFAQRFEGAIDEPAHVPAVDELVGSFAGGVVAAGQHARLEVEAVAAEGLDDLERVLPGEGEVVVGVDEQDFFVRAAGFCADDLWVVVAGADGGPQSRGRGPA